MDNVAVGGLVGEVEEFVRRIKENAKEQAKTLAALRADPVMDISAKFDPGEEIFKWDFLSRGEGMLFVGETGIGKSSLMMQGAFLWALGRDLYQIRPARPLTTLVVQAENHLKEIAKERDGILHGLQLSREEQELIRGRVFTKRITSATGEHLVEKMRALLSERPYDLVILDPANSYHGGDTNSQKDMSKFLREEVNLLAEEFRVGFIVCHHTNKPKKDDKGKTITGFGKYAGSGSSEFGNWARGVWTLLATEVEGTFIFSCPKRGQALGWRNESDEKIFSQYISHSGEEGPNGQEYAYWRSAEFSELPSDKQIAKPKVEQQIANLFNHPGEKLTRGEFVERAKKAGVKKNTYCRWWRVTGKEKNVLKFNRDESVELADGFCPSPDIESEDFYQTE